MSRIADQCSTIVEHHQAIRIDGYLVDVQTARALLAVYAALKPETREKFDSVPIDKLAMFAWGHVR